MIRIKHVTDCCGCGACVEKCPRNCINFNEDREGFRYPLVNEVNCIECGLCEKVCPVLNKFNTGEIKRVLAAQNQDVDIRKESSSGGIFTAIGIDIINRGGVVFGARYDNNWEVYHSYVERIEELYLFRGSKYMQSRIDNSYHNAETFLKQGRLVLFSGTPCQIAGLKHFLRKSYNNLYTVDFICHGVPSPKVWRRYLAEVVADKFSQKDIKIINHVQFRAKRSSWLSSKIIIGNQDKEIIHTKTSDSYFESFTKNVILRPICYSCPFKNGRGQSDMTIADFWGIQNVDPKMHDDTGTSMIIIHNDRLKMPENVNYRQEPTEVIGLYNGAYYHSSMYNGNRKVFYGLMDSSLSIIDLMKRCTHPNLFQKIWNVLYRKFGE